MPSPRPPFTRPRSGSGARSSPARRRFAVRTSTARRPRAARRSVAARPRTASGAVRRDVPRRYTPFAPSFPGAYRSRPRAGGSSRSADPEWQVRPRRCRSALRSSDGRGRIPVRRACGRKSAVRDDTASVHGASRALIAARVRASSSAGRLRPDVRSRNRERSTSCRRASVRERSGAGTRSRRASPSLERLGIGPPTASPRTERLVKVHRPPRYRADPGSDANPCIR